MCRRQNLAGNMVNGKADGRAFSGNVTQQITTTAHRVEGQNMTTTLSIIMFNKKQTDSPHILKKEIPWPKGIPTTEFTAEFDATDYAEQTSWSDELIKLGWERTTSQGMD